MTRADDENDGIHRLSFNISEVTGLDYLIRASSLNLLFDSRAVAVAFRHIPLVRGRGGALAFAFSR